MKDSKLIALYRTLDKTDIKRLAVFINSAYFNKNKAVIRLFKAIAKNYPEFPPKKIKKTTLFPLVFSNQVFSDVALRRVMSKLLSLTEQYLQDQQFRSSAYLADITLLKVYNNKGLPKHFNGIASNIDFETKNVDAFYAQYQLEWEKNELENQLAERRLETNLQLASDNLDTFYIINKLKMACSIASYQTMFQREYDIQFMSEITAHLEAKPPQETLVRLYYYGFLTFQDPENEHHFKHLKKLMQDEERNIPEKEYAFVNKIIINYCIKKINTGNTPYFSQLLEIYKMGLNKGIVQENSKHFLTTSINIVSLALKLKEYDWVVHFLDQYGGFIEEEYRQNHINYNLARLYFEQGNYSNIIKLIKDFNHRDLVVILNSRTLLIKTYYELEEYEALDYLLESFNQFINRKQKMTSHKNHFINFVKIMRKLMGLKGEKKDASALIEQITHTAELAEKPWLLSKASLL